MVIPARANETVALRRHAGHGGGKRSDMDDMAGRE
jgi:hypothetical protein